MPFFMFIHNAKQQQFFTFENLLFHIMTKLFSVGFWAAIARIILKNRITIIILITIATIGLATQFKHMRFTYTEANLLPDDHEINQEYYNICLKRCNL